MIRRITVLPKADRDLDFIAAYFGQVAGVRFYRACWSTFRQLLKRAGIGEPQEYDDPELAGLRCASVSSFKSYLIF